MFCDGWVLRFADGYTKRANSINPLYSTNASLGERIELCRRIYETRGLTPAFKMTPAVVPAWLDGLLAEADFQLCDHTSVQLLDFKKFPKQANQTNLHVATSLEDSWLNNCCRLNQIDDSNRAIFVRMLAKIIPSCFFISLQEKGETVACGLGVLERGYLGLFDIVVDAKLRGQGYGRALVLSLLHLGRENGAEHAYLQVRINNLPALSLYEKLGFREKYRYWYRIPAEISIYK
jgi:GNAT superfamily N-acetyltransferase